MGRCVLGACLQSRSFKSVTARISAPNFSCMRCTTGSAIARLRAPAPFVGRGRGRFRRHRRPAAHHLELQRTSGGLAQRRLDDALRLRSQRDINEHLRHRDLHRNLIALHRPFAFLKVMRQHLLPRIFQSSQHGGSRHFGRDFITRLRRSAGSRATAVAVAVSMFDKDASGSAALPTAGELCEVANAVATRLWARACDCGRPRTETAG